MRWLLSRLRDARARRRAEWVAKRRQRQHDEDWRQFEDHLGFNDPDAYMRYLDPRFDRP